MSSPTVCDGRSLNNLNGFKETQFANNARTLNKGATIIIVLTDQLLGQGP